MQNKEHLDFSSFNPSDTGNLLKLQAAALEATANAVVITDTSGTVIWVNAAFEQITGYSRAEILGQNARLLKAVQNPPALYEEMWRTILGGQRWRGELTNRRKDGSLYHEEMIISPVRDSKVGITHFVAITLNISERRESEAKLRYLTERLSLAAGVAKIGVWELDLATNVFTWDVTTFEIYGFPPVVSIPYEQWSAAVYPEDLPAVEAALRRVIEKKGQGSAEFRIIRTDGVVRNVSVAARVTVDELGNFNRVVGTAQDVSEQMRAEKRLQDSESKHRVLFESSADAHLLSDETGFVDCNSALLQMFGYSTRTELTGLTPADLSPSNQPDGTPSRAAADREIATAFLNGTNRFEWLHRRKSGEAFPAEVTLTALTLDGRPALLGTVRDITKQKKAEEQLQLWARVLDQSAEAIIVCDPQERILLVNNAFELLTGFAQDEAVGNTPRILQSGRQDRAFYADMWKSVLETGMWHGEVWNRRKTGELYAEWLSISAVYNQKGAVTQYIGIFSDITVRKQSDERMFHLAHFDPLTDLPNRVLLMDRLNQLTKAAARKKSKVAAVFIDLDRFKEVNDSLGHDAGDQLLRTLAKRLSSTVRAEDTVARIGGDEFVVLIQGLHEGKDAAIVARELLSCLLKPVTLNGYELTVTASMGISVYPDDATNGQEMIRNADAAMYQAKGAGRNAFQFYTSDLNKRALEMLSVEIALRQAIEHREFVLHYQPQVDISSGRVVGAEALIRWNHPDSGLVMPGKFISIAEERGLIVPIGKWVVEQAARQAAVWQNSERLSVPIAMNVSAIQFRQKDFVEQLTNSVRNYGINSNRLELELTESIIMHDAPTTVGILKKLHDLGFQLSIDDFGTGYSSLNYLRRFPIDKIKIDQSFIADVTQDETARSMVAAIINLARSLRLKVIAEGVQTMEQLEILREMRCDEAQGFLYSTALVSGEFEKFVRKWEPKYVNLLGLCPIS